MKTVIYQDERGLLHRAQIPDTMNASLAMQGIPLDPPDLAQLLDWDELKRKLQNALIENNLFELKDLQGNDRLKNVILTVFQRPITDLYRNHQPNQPLAAHANGHSGGVTHV